jgi:hypothetical protein
MNQHRVPNLSRSLTRIPSRRDVLRGLASAGLGLGLARLPAAAEARKKRKKKNKKPKPPRPNAYGCRSVGVACTTAEQCCSGICEGKKCRAHGVGTCLQKEPGVCNATNPLLLTCNLDGDCGCVRTTAGSNFCSAFFGVPVNQFCADCRRDPDCETLGFPAGSACVPLSQGGCIGTCDSDRACLPPCGYEPPAPDIP